MSENEPATLQRTCYLTLLNFSVLEARIWLEIARIVRLRWDRRDHGIDGHNTLEIETLWSNDDVQSIEVRNYVY